MGTSRDVFFIPIQAINYPLVSEKEMAENYQQCHILSFIQAEIVIVQSHHRRALFACFSLFFLSNCRLATFYSEVKNRRYRVFLDYKFTKLKESPNKLLTTRFSSKLSSVKCFTRTREHFEGIKHSLFIFTSHSPLSFRSWGNLKVLTFDFEWFSFEVH